MTPEQIEAALEQPEHGGRLLKMAKARLDLEDALDVFDAATCLDETVDECSGALEAADNLERSVFEDIALPFFPMSSITEAVDVIEDHYKGIKARLLSPEYRLKEAVK